jgi:alkanesulfonate monooxygenase SsuD/methylene tetrahydromethanopterin reductase-like flavin-dependent oxidoreductase (luciferase family)
VRIAEEYAMLQHLSKGRMDLMLGRGNTAPVYPWFGQDIRQGLPLALENYNLLHRLWREDVVDWEGKFRTPLQGFTSSRGRWTTCRRSSGTARSAPPRSPSRPPTTETASSPTTSSGPRSTTCG